MHFICMASGKERGGIVGVCEEEGSGDDGAGGGIQPK